MPRYAKKKSYAKKRSYGGTAKRRTAYKKKGGSKRSAKVTASKLLLSGSRLVDMELRANHKLDLDIVPVLPVADGTLPDLGDLVGEQIFEPIPWAASDTPTDPAATLGGKHVFRGRKGFYKSIKFNGVLSYKGADATHPGSTYDAIRWRLLIFSVKQAMTAADLDIMADFDRTLTSQRDLTVMPKILCSRHGVLNSSKDLESMSVTCDLNRYISRRVDGTAQVMGGGSAADGLSNTVNQTERVFCMLSSDAPNEAGAPTLHFKGYFDSLGCEPSSTAPPLALAPRLTRFLCLQMTPTDGDVYPQTSQTIQMSCLLMILAIPPLSPSLPTRPSATRATYARTLLARSGSWAPSVQRTCCFTSTARSFPPAG